ncbi:hypothetical protein KJR58_24205 [Escherichia coli]|nr:hypothetical protein [Escherichia coli]
MRIHFQQIIRNLLKVDTHLIPMSEHPVDLMASDDPVSYTNLTLPTTYLL